MSNKSNIHDDAIGQAYQQQSNELPSSALDQQILAASRKAVAAKPTPVGKTRSWRNMPFIPAIAASFFVVAVFWAQQEPDNETRMPQAEVAPMSISAPALLKSAAPQMAAQSEPEVAMLADMATPETLSPLQGVITQRAQAWWLITQEQEVLIHTPPSNIADFAQQPVTVQGVLSQRNGVTELTIKDIKLD
ncbi:hypothetical protein [Motilimonas eburnea]|uniref:hypothetical protein n=1 Tax=Motilimonas eburnea TaxID=1737488 RepID=UPI001E508694|nr:hypothetical protein [Motilimonas eburnea]MCE2571233.1 hypothetical protein [Motilimonas eburnea]